MKIVEEYNDYKIKSFSVQSAKYTGDFTIRIYFSDNSNRLVNFKSFLESSFHPSIRKYLDENKFRDFKIIDGNLNWNNYDLIFPIGDLHQGII